MALIRGSTNEHIWNSGVSASRSYCANRLSIALIRAPRNVLPLYLFLSVATSAYRSLTTGMTWPAEALSPSRSFVAALKGINMSLIVSRLLRSSLEKKTTKKVNNSNKEYCMMKSKTTTPQTTEDAFTDIAHAKHGSYK